MPLPCLGIALCAQTRRCRRLHCVASEAAHAQSRKVFFRLILKIGKESTHEHVKTREKCVHVRNCCFLLNVGVGCCVSRE